MTTRVFLDLDGTIYVDGVIIDNVDAELCRVASLGMHIHYLTNNTSSSSDQYIDKLSKLNLPVSEKSVISPTVILSDWLRNRCSRIFAVGTGSFCEELKFRSGVEITEHNAEVVIVAFDRELTYAKLESACRLINAGVPWYLTHIDLACPTRQGPIPDCGSIGQLIEATTGIAPSGHFGKPGELMLDYLRRLIRTDEHVIVAGDRLYTDAAVGLELGAQTILVCTGEFDPTTSQCDERIEVHRTLAEFLQLSVA